MNAPTTQDFVIVTSNANKIREYQRIAGDKLTTEPGEDLPEILGTPDEIIIHKAIMAGEGRMVEDAIVWINGEAHVDVKWKIDAMLRGDYPLGSELTWEVRLAVVHQGVVYAYLGQTVGTLSKPEGVGFGIDPVIKVQGIGKTLAQLDEEGIKDDFSARCFAAQKVLNEAPYLSVKVSEVKPWEGQWQNE